MKLPYCTSTGIVQAVLFAILLYLGLGSVFTQDRICLVDGRKRHEEEYEDGNADNHDGKRYQDAVRSDAANCSPRPPFVKLDLLPKVSATYERKTRARAP